MQERPTDFRTDPALRATRTIVLNAGDPEAKREEIRRYFHATWDIDEALLVLASPYTWLTEHTAREEWIGGFRKDGEPYTTTQALDELLGTFFTRRAEPEDIPFVLRETRRKHQHSIAELTVWERR